jgi:hypothetical protein
MKTTYFPCVRGTMGDWTYYVAVMGVVELVRYVRFAEEVSPNQDLDKMIQREVSDRAKRVIGKSGTTTSAIVPGIFVCVSSERWMPARC